MKRSILTGMKVALSLAMVFVVTSGCEDDASTDIGDISDISSAEHDASVANLEMAISPTTPSVSQVGDKISFGVSGGDAPYTWSLSSTAIGTLNSYASEKAHDGVIYTATAVKANTITVNDHIGRSVSVTITAGGSGALTISPATVNIPDTLAYQAQFTATKGLPPYTWICSAPSLGTLSTAGLWANGAGAVALTNSVNVTITVKDSLDDTASSTLTIKGE